MHKVLVCGDRRWWDYEWVYTPLFHLKEKYGSELIIVQGEADGADIMGKEAAIALQLEHRDYPALWHRYGGAAGPIRNKKQFNEEQPDLTMAFHDNIVISKGTLNMINYAVSRDCPTIVMHHSEETIMDYQWWGNVDTDLLPF